MPKHPSALCNGCPLEDERYTKTWRPMVQVMPVLWVGQAPGKTERVTNKPFSGSAGRHHFTLCKRAGLNKEGMPHTNIINCWPGPKPNSKSDREPTKEEIACCNPRLKTEIQQIKPKLIIALGGPAVYTLTGLTKPMKTMRGHVHKLQARYDYDCDVYCCYHPSFSMRRREWIDLCINDYKNIPKILDGTFNQRLEKGLTDDFIYNPEPEQLQQFLSSGKLYACDLETTGLNPRRDKITGAGFTNVTTLETCAIDLRGPGDPRWEPFRQFMESPSHGKIWQNGSFDSGMLRYGAGIQDQGFQYDTRLAEQLIHSDLPSDLQHLRALYTDVPEYKPSRKEMKNTAIWTSQKLLEVVGLDAITTAKVFEAQSNTLTDKENSLIKDHLIPLVYALGRMQDRGVLVQVEKLAAMYAQIQPRIEELEDYFWKKGVNVRSAIQMRDYFDLPNTQYDTIMAESKIRPDPEFNTLVEHRKLSKIASTYLLGVYKRLEEGNRIHTEFKIEGTATGRLSSSNPNLQNVPKELRAIYIPDPGKVFIKADYSQVELWVGATLAYQVSGKHKMLDDLKSGTDIHYIACQVCYPKVKIKHGSRDKDFTSDQVTAAKTVVFGTFYGRTPRSVAIQFGVTTRQAELWQVRLINHYPELLDYKEYCEEMFQSKGYIESPFGRRRYLANIRQGYNHPVQSGAGDVTLGALWRIDNAGLFPVLSVHDDIVISADQEDPLPEAKRFKKIMERPIPELENMTPRADYEIGDDWYNLKPLEI